MSRALRAFIAGLILLRCGLALSQQTPLSPAPPQASGVETPPVAGASRRVDPPPGAMPFVHDPSTVIKYRGKYYVDTTGRGIPMLSSPDLVNWTRIGSVFTQIPDRVRAAVPKNNGIDVWAPDILRIGDTFYLYYAVSSWGSFRSAVALATNTSLDPADPSYKWVDQGVVVDSDGIEEMNAIDPGVVHAPDGTSWICYGSYHGSIKILQLDSKTGLALAGASAKASAVAIARQSEAADIISHDGYFYLFVNHGSCCQGKKSEYNIRVGRSRLVTGPYLDKHGIALTAGGGSLFLAAHDHRIGPGHFGRVIEETREAGTVGQVPLERFSLHYEADLDNLGRPTLGIRPLLWSPDSWPVAGDRLDSGVYQILSSATEDALGINVASEGAASPLRLGNYLAIETQQWLIEPAGEGFYKLLNLATREALGANLAGEVTLQSVNGSKDAELQLWQLNELTDGSYRIMSKVGNKTLSRNKQNGLHLTPFNASDEHRWIVGLP